MAQVTLTSEGPMAILTLSAPAQGNRVSKQMMVDLVKAVEALTARPALRALLIRAEGPRFCIGGAIDEFGIAEPLAEAIARDLPVAHQAMAALARLQMPIVSALQGAVAGGGIGIALLGDVVLAAPDVVFRAGYPGIALSPDLGSSWQVMRRAGPAFSTEFFLTNRKVEAEEALSRGLVNRLIPADRLQAEAMALTRQLSQGPTRSHAAVRALHNSPGTTFESHMAKEALLMEASARTQDAKAAIEDFRAGRPPSYQGQ